LVELQSDVEEKVHAHIAEYRTQGYPDDKIQEALLKSNIDPFTISRLMGKTVVTDSKPFYKQKWFLLPLGILLLFLIVLGLFALFDQGEKGREGVSQDTLDESDISEVSLGDSSSDDESGIEPQCGDDICDIGEESCLSDCGCVNDSDCTSGYACTNGACKKKSSSSSGGSSSSSSGGSGTSDDENLEDDSSDERSGTSSVVETLCADTLDNNEDGTVDSTGGCDVDADQALDYVCGCYIVSTEAFTSYEDCSETDSNSCGAVLCTVTSTSQTTENYGCKNLDSSEILASVACSILDSGVGNEYYSADSDCQEGEVCTDDEECVGNLSCSNDANFLRICEIDSDSDGWVDSEEKALQDFCNSGEDVECENNQCNDAFLCVECDESSDCASGEVCDSDVCVSCESGTAYSSESICEIDSDGDGWVDSEEIELQDFCNSGEDAECENNQCNDAFLCVECDESSDCASGEVCDSDVCVEETESAPYADVTLCEEDTDCARDETCISFVCYTTECSDSIDNDGDGVADLDDSDCTDASDTSESSEATSFAYAPEVEEEGFFGKLWEAFLQFLGIGV